MVDNIALSEDGRVVIVRCTAATARRTTTCYDDLHDASHGTTYDDDATTMTCYDAFDMASCAARFQ